jgi:hypothetical protein
MGINLPVFHNNAAQKDGIGWLPDGRKKEITANGIYKLYALENPSGTVVAYIQKKIQTNGTFWNTANPLDLIFIFLVQSREVLHYMSLTNVLLNKPCWST